MPVPPLAHGEEGRCGRSACRHNGTNMGQCRQPAGNPHVEGVEGQTACLSRGVGEESVRVAAYLSEGGGAVAA
jgi:hypothetical protein